MTSTRFETPSYGTVAALYGHPASVLVMMIVMHINGIHATGPRELSRILNKNEDRIREGLRVLQQYGLAACNGNRYGGWYLTGQALQLPLMNILGAPEEEGSPQNVDSTLLELPSPAASPQKTWSQNESESTFCGLDPAQEAGVHKTRVQNESESTKRGLPTTSLSLSLSCCLTDQEKQQQPQLAAQQALAAAGLDEGQIADFLARYPPAYLLEKCDYYDWARHEPRPNGEGTYANDLGWLVRCIIQGYRPPKKFVPGSERCPQCNRRLTDHRPGCPALLPPGVGDDLPAGSARPNSPDHTADAPIDTSDGTSTPAAGSPRPSEAAAAAVWQPILYQLGGDMRRVDFETWVAPLRAVALDNGKLRLGSRNRYARDWCADHLSSTIDGLLPLITGQPATVEFIVIT
jgi:DnaA N-terminal domain